MRSSRETAERESLYPTYVLRQHTCMGDITTQGRILYRIWQRSAPSSAECSTALYTACFETLITDLHPRIALGTRHESCHVTAHSAGSSTYQSSCFDQRWQPRHCVSRQAWLHPGHTPRVSNVFQTWPQAHDQRSCLRGTHLQSGQRILGSRCLLPAELLPCSRIWNWNQRVAVISVLLVRA
jgi:hypothetical protein